MADFARITTTNWYIGASTDTKPAAGTCPKGSTCYETDTGDVYITADGGTTWTLKRDTPEKLDDSAFTPGTSVLIPVGLLADETAPDSVDEGDVGIPRMTLSRILWAALRVKAAASADTELTLGQATMAASLPVVIASNQSAVPVSLAALPALVAGSATIGATQDAGPSWTSSRQTTTSADMTGAADLTAAPTAGQKIVIDDVIASSDTAMSIDFLEETSGTLIFRLFLPAGGSAQVTMRSKLKLDTANKKLRGDASIAGNVAITVLYHSEA